MDKLIVKNFGPIKDVEIKLNKINLFIGENGSGKSVLAKLITILTNYQELSSDTFFQQLEDYNINYIDKKTYIKYTFQQFQITIENQSFKVNNILKLYLQTNKSLASLNMDDIIEKFEKLKKLNIVDNEMRKQIDKVIDNNEKNRQRREKHSFNVSSQYIPAERNLISLFNKSLATLLVAEVPLPKFLLQYSSAFEKASHEIKELDFLNVRYVNKDGIDRHMIYYNKNNSLSLESASSGIQSALPLYLTVQYLSKKHKNIIIEELEQNLFPKAQKETLKFIVSNINNKNNLFMMTHSPYVLSTLNILLYAYKTAILNYKAKEEVEKIIPESQWINPDEFSVYYLEKGIARNIQGKTGLISDNEIDDISDNINSEFNDLVHIYREYKNDK